MTSEALEFQQLKSLENFFRSIDGRGLRDYTHSTAGMGSFDLDDSSWKLPFITLQGILNDHS